MMVFWSILLKVLISCYKVSFEWYLVLIKLKSYVLDKIVLVNFKFSLLDRLLDNLI